MPPKQTTLQRILPRHRRPPIPRTRGWAVELDARATQITAGVSHTCALLEGGRVRCWGDDPFVVPSLAPGTTDPSVPREVSLGLSAGEQAFAITGSHDHVCGDRCLSVRLAPATLDSLGVDTACCGEECC